MSALAAPALAQTAPPLRGGDASTAETPSDALPDLDTPPPPPVAARAKPLKRDALPPLAPYRGAQRLGLRGGADAAQTEPSPTVAAIPAPPPRRAIRREERPFDPVGLYVGDLKLTPYVEQSLGYASNPLGIAGAHKGSAVSLTEIGVGLQSNWSRNELTGAAKLGYGAYPAAPGANAPLGSGVLDYRLDASRDLSFDTEGRYNLGTQTNAQLGLNGLTSNKLTLVSTYGATGGVVNRFGDLSLGLHGSVDRVQYDGGGLSSEDYNDYGLKLRASYRLSAVVQPFAEVGGDIRSYDTKIDAAGYDRASDGLSGKAGLRLALSEMLTGEIDAGYGVRAYRDRRLEDVGAPLFDASLVWAPTPLTTVTLKASSLINDSVVAGASADINRAYTINLDHALTERVKLGVSAGLTTDRYVGVGETDRTYTLGATAEYHLSREVVLKASAIHSMFSPGGGAPGYSSDTVLLGVRLQR